MIKRREKGDFLNFLILLEEKRRFLEECVDKDVMNKTPAENKDYILSISKEMDDLIADYYKKNKHPKNKDQQNKSQNHKNEENKI